MDAAAAVKSAGGLPVVEDVKKMSCLQTVLVSCPTNPGRQQFGSEDGERSHQLGPVVFVRPLDDGQDKSESEPERQQSVSNANPSYPRAVLLSSTTL